MDPSDFEWELVVDYNPITYITKYCYYDQIDDVKTEELPLEVATFISTTKPNEWIGHLSTSHLPFKQFYTHKPSGLSTWHEPSCLRELRDGYIDNIDDWSIRSKKLEMSQELQDKFFDFDDLIVNNSSTEDSLLQQQIKINRVRYENKVSPDWVCFYRNNITQACSLELPAILDNFQQQQTLSHRDWSPQLSSNCNKFFYVHAKTNVCLWDMPLLYKINRDKHISNSTQDDWRVFISAEYKKPLYLHIKSKVTQFELPAPLKDVDQTIINPLDFVGGINPLTSLPYYYCASKNLTMWHVPRCIRKLKRCMLYKRIADEQKALENSEKYDDKDYEYWEVQYTAYVPPNKDTEAKEDLTSKSTHIIYYKHRLTHECTLTLPPLLQQFVKTTQKSDWIKVNITNTSSSSTSVQAPPLFYYEHKKPIPSKLFTTETLIEELYSYNPLNKQSTPPKEVQSAVVESAEKKGDEDNEGVCIWTSPLDIINDYLKMTQHLQTEFGSTEHRGSTQGINPDDDIDNWMIYYDPHATTTVVFDTFNAVQSGVNALTGTTDLFSQPEGIPKTHSRDPSVSARAPSQTRKSSANLLQYTQPGHLAALSNISGTQPSARRSRNLQDDRSDSDGDDDNHKGESGLSGFPENDAEDEDGGFGGLVHSGTLSGENGGFGNYSGYLGDLLGSTKDLIPSPKNGGLTTLGEDDDGSFSQAEDRGRAMNHSPFSSPISTTTSLDNNSSRGSNHGSAQIREYSMDPVSRFGGLNDCVDPVSRMGRQSTVQRHLTSQKKGQPFYFNTVTRKLTTDLPDCFDIFQLNNPSQVSDWESVVGKLAPCPFYRYKPNKSITMWHEPHCVAEFRQGEYQAFEEQHLFDTIKDWSVRFVVETNNAYYKNNKTLWYQTSIPFALKEYAEQNDNINEWESIMSQTCPGVVVYCHVDLKTNNTKCAILEPPPCAQLLCSKIDPSTTASNIHRIKFPAAFPASPQSTVPTSPDNDFNFSVTYEDNALNWTVQYDPDTNYTYYRNYKTLHCTPNIPKCLYMLGTSKYTMYDDWKQIPAYFDLDGILLKQDQKDKLDQELLTLQQQNKKIKKLYIEKQCWGYKIPNSPRYIRLYHQPRVVKDFLRQNDQAFDWCLVRSGDNSKFVYKNKKTFELSTELPNCLFHWLLTDHEASLPDNWTGSIDSILKKSYYKHKITGIMLMNEHEPPCLKKVRLDTAALSTQEQLVAQWTIMASRSDSCCYYMNKITKQCVVGSLPEILLDFSCQTRRKEWNIVSNNGMINKPYWHHIQSGLRLWERPDFIDSDSFTDEELNSRIQPSVLAPPVRKLHSVGGEKNADQSAQTKPKLNLKPKMLKPSSIEQKSISPGLSGSKLASFGSTSNTKSPQTTEELPNPIPE